MLALGTVTRPLAAQKSMMFCETMPLVAGTTGIWLALGISEFLTTLCIVSFYLIRHRAKSRS